MMWFDFIPMDVYTLLINQDTVSSLADAALYARCFPGF